MQWASAWGKGPGRRDPDLLNWSCMPLQHPGGHVWCSTVWKSQTLLHAAEPGAESMTRIQTNDCSEYRETLEQGTLQTVTSLSLMVVNCRLEPMLKTNLHLHVLAYRPNINHFFKTICWHSDLYTLFGLFFKETLCYLGFWNLFEKNKQKATKNPREKYRWKNILAELPNLRNITKTVIHL